MLPSSKQLPSTKILNSTIASQRDSSSLRDGDESGGYESIGEVVASGAMTCNSDEGMLVQKKDLSFYVTTICFLLFSFCIAMIQNDLGIVLALVGATGSTLVSYVLPGLIYVKVHKPLDTSKICAYVQLGLGCFIMPTALYFIFSGINEHD